MNEIWKLKPTKAATIILCCSNVFIVFVSIFLLNRTLFLSLNLWQLLGICLGITCPSLAALSVFFGLLNQEEDSFIDKDERETKRWAFAGFAGTILLSINLLFSYWTKDSLKFYFATVAGAESIVIIFALVGDHFKKQKKAKPTKNIENSHPG